MSSVKARKDQENGRTWREPKREEERRGHSVKEVILIQ